MHGASENLVSQIMADAFQSGAADKLLASQGLDVGSAAKEREDINAKITEASRGRAEQEKNLREAGDDGLLVIEATQGRRILLPAGSIGYIELGQEHARPVGFGFSGE